MSHNIPFDIQVQIMKQLPVKSLLQFRTVSKAWKSLIDSPRFINRYSGQQQHILVSCWHGHDTKYVTLVDDATFPHHVLSHTLPACLNMLYWPDIIGASHGLFGLYDDRRVGRGMSDVIWNPSIRKAVVVEVPNVENNMLYRTVLGFGVCRQTTDPKIVNIRYIKIWQDMTLYVEVFTLSTGTWRSPYSNSNLPRVSIEFDKKHMVVIDGVVYWLANEMITMDDGTSNYYSLVILFDMTSEEFREVNLPDSLVIASLAPKPSKKLSIHELRGSLVVLEDGVEAHIPVLSIWMMEESVPKSFTKLLTFSSHTLDLINHGYFVKGFRKTGELIIEIYSFDEELDESLAVYESCSMSISNIGVKGGGMPPYVYSYTESLLLL